MTITRMNGVSTRRCGNTEEVRNLVTGGGNREGFLEVSADLFQAEQAGRGMQENKGDEPRNDLALGPDTFVLE